ncbi:MAG: thioredoxin domain-containing protein [Oligoflexales bacterium]
MRDESYLPLPGLPAVEPFLVQQFQEIRQRRRTGYRPRTRHVHSDGEARYTNRLFLESSPYLLQHAHNPVNWYPWGEEAFGTARDRSLPIFLSIGYSTCHWCHVMEEESFEDEEIAKFLNENYIAIKVDREERPDVDATYMASVQALTGRGGWPMSVWLMPDKKPFYGGTYFPPQDGFRGANIGFLTILQRISHIYKSDRENILQQGLNLTSAVKEYLQPKHQKTRLPSVDVLGKAFAYYHANFDPVHGGIRRAPKFPSSLPIRFLLRHHLRGPDNDALAMATQTLRKMARGGIYDQICGGFHRYSTDEEWLVPHFEKMLYDNALLVTAFSEAYQLTKDEEFRSIVTETLEYLDRDMTSSEGVFYSATDADSLTESGHKEEGYFFTWTEEELRNALVSASLTNLVQEFYRTTASGNFEGRNILHVHESIEEFSARRDQSPQETAQKLKEAKALLLRKRDLRPKPLRDEKILVAWNALMISALVKAGLAMGNTHYIERAERAANFIRDKMFENGLLYRIYMDGERKIPGFLEDYSFLTAASLDLFEATGRTQWFDFAFELDRILNKGFEDTVDGGFFMTSSGHEELIVREKPAYDGAEPSGNSIAILNLLRMYSLTHDHSCLERAEEALRYFGKILDQAPAALSEMLLAVDNYLSKSQEIVFLTEDSEEAYRIHSEFLQTLYSQFLPNKVVVSCSRKYFEEMAKRISFLRDKEWKGDAVTAYVCERGECRLPTNDVAKFAEILRSSY